MADVKARRVDAVVAAFDLPGRSVRHLVETLELFRHLGVESISLREQIDTGSPPGKAISPHQCSRGRVAVWVRAIVAAFLLLPAMPVHAQTGTIYWAIGFSSHGAISRANRDGSAYEVIANGFGDLRSIGLDEANSSLFVTDPGDSAIKRGNLDGTGLSDVIRGLPLPYGLALDTIQGVLYFSGYSDGQLHSVKTDGTNLATIPISGTTAYALALNSTAQQLYYEGVSGAGISRVNVDGTNETSLVPVPSGAYQGSTTGIALDLVDGTMYWVTGFSQQGAIFRANLDGSGLATLVSPVKDAWGFALDLTGGKMYWNEDANNSNGSFVKRANLDGSNVETIIDGTVPPFAAFLKGIALCDSCAQLTTSTTATTTTSSTTTTIPFCQGRSNGTACNDGNACTGPDACQSGVCTGLCQVGQTCGGGCAAMQCTQSGSSCSCQSPATTTTTRTTSSTTTTTTQPTTTSTTTTASTSRTTTTTLPGTCTGACPIDTVFLILMENQNWSSIKNSSSAPYINGTLLPIASHAEQYYNPPDMHPSLPNYLWLEAGTNFGIFNDNLPAQDHQSTSNHLVNLLEVAGISWKTYQEDEGSGAYDGTDCPVTNEGNFYDVNHNPFVYFDDVTENLNPSAPRCIQRVRPYSELQTDLINNEVPRYNFIVPHLCHDMHTSCAPLRDPVRQGDTWLSAEVPNILASQAYANNGALFILWDESDSWNAPIGMIVLSPKAKGGGYQNTIQYDHSSTLRTVEEIFGVTPMLGGAANAADLRDLFVSFP